MQRLNTVAILFAILLLGCNTRQEDNMTGFEAFCEMVANDAKPIALSEAMSSEDMEANWEFYERIAKKYRVEIYRETEFVQTSLFPASVTEGKEVVLIYRDSRLVQYQQLKEDLDSLQPIDAARRLGRLLGYSANGINELLMKNSKFRTLNSFGVQNQITHLYYENFDEAIEFYSEILGLQLSDSNRFMLSSDVSIQLHKTNLDHPMDQPKSTAIAFLTNQLPEWYDYVQKMSVPIKYTYKPKDGGPHDGFVAIDPGGYLLEFEEFKQHQENELFMAVLENSLKVNTKIDSLNFFGSITWTYHNDMLKMQRFYEEILGFRMVADQGWTKIYQTSPSGFIGLVDEKRGMMDYADEKAVEIEWKLADLNPAVKCFSEQELNWDSANDSFYGPEKYKYLLR